MRTALRMLRDLLFRARSRPSAAVHSGPASDGGAGRPSVETARIAGLASFATPTLEAVESRRLQLWALTLCLMLATAVGLVLISEVGKVELPEWMTPQLMQTGLIAFILLFAAYAIEKELQLRRLSRLLVEERVLAAALTNRLREVSALLSAAKAMNLAVELEAVLETVLRCALELLQGSDGSIMLVHGKSELRTVGTSGASPARGARVRFGEGVAGKVAASREPTLISGVIQHEPGDQARLDVPPPVSSMSVPLIHRTALLGVLNVNASPGRSFTEYDLRALGLFAEQAAGALANAQLLEEQRLLATRTLYQAMHDGLTNLPNRSLFIDRIGHALARRRAPDRRVAVLFLDLDDFKRINDSLGHAAGDDVLIAFAERLRGCVRSADTVARFGGDEFGVLVEDVAAPIEAVATAQRVLETLDQPFLVADRQVVLHGSIGLALEAEGVTSAQDLVRNADTAMHHAKRAGKARIERFVEGMHREAVEELDLESEMREALARGEFVLHYQPVVALASREPVGVEALLRWAHPKRGLLRAATFVPLAERIGMLEAIDRWALSEACRTAQFLLGSVDLPPHFAMHVNVSPTRLMEDGFNATVSAALAESGLPAGRLVLEITENAELRDTEEALARLESLRASGVRLALDDFGTGSSSLSHLRRMPVDAVKIDRVFIDGLTDDASVSPLVQAILRIGQGLSLAVIAEGVENQSQVGALLRAGCSLGQGYFLAAPLSREELAVTLRWSPAMARPGGAAGA